MKKHPKITSKAGVLITLLCLIGLQVASAAGHEPLNSNSSSSRNARQTLWSSDMAERSLILQGGLSQHFKYGSEIGFKGTMDYQFATRWTIGGQAEIYFGNRKELAQDRTPGLGLRTTYLLTKPKRYSGESKWNVYCGLAGIAYFGAGNKAKSDVDFQADPMLGARYGLGGKWALWGELSYRTASFGLALTL